ncbi:NADH-quinone oxidoreductase subunit NuoG [Lacimicrobium alkaliphilum]|uniref:NADH-quinone oxidoreductase subunit G n=1 Tax=Lacimicrobium alkaliphilum TaxID=1526571 RepID=A0ABQ1R8Q1_9ALTE|nr:NADH-quinone oxidoreductase subunit NuoG [Lacimicrobium alkaliphilum]GGD60517.1 NADH-quinone oxidoreductase subunit G [Lacimicrobium alkaliphilum]
MIKIFIDGQDYKVIEGQNLLQACLSLKLNLPYFCWHPSMGSVGACRQCAVTRYEDEDDRQGKIIIACMTPVEEGMRVSVKQSQESEFREQIIAAMMTHHPHDCPVCAEGGECHLQDMTVMTGHYARQFKGRKTSFNNQYLGPLLKHEMNRCITCYRCVRFYRDYAGGEDLSAQASKNHVYFGRQTDGVLQSEFAGNLAEVCPTGVFTDKPFGNHYSRKWDMQAAPSVCQHCSVGCNTSLSERYGSVRRVTNRFNAHLNGYFLCDRGRYGFDFVNSPQRCQQIRSSNKPAQWQDDSLQRVLSAPGRWIGIGSSQASLEDNFALQQLVGKDNFCPDLDDKQQSLMQLHGEILQQYPMASLAEIERADAVLILGEDINCSAPRMALAIRQALLNKARDKVETLNVPGWQDAAVRNVLPDNPVPLIWFGYGESELQSSAQLQLLCDDHQAARQGFALAGLLCGHNVGVEVSEAQQQTRQAAGILQKASRPLLIGGWSAGNPALLAALANLRKALGEKASMAIAAPEHNSLGLSVLMQKGHLSAASLEQSIDREPVNLLVLDYKSQSWRTRMASLMEKAKQTVRLGLLGNESAEEALLPVAAFSECSGSAVNYQGRVQYWQPASKASGDCLPGWQWLVHLAKIQQKSLAEVEDLGQLRQRLMADYPQLEGAWENDPRQQAIAQQPPRYSGRTAMLANQTVHEPKPYAEPQAPYRQSMEGGEPRHSETHAQPYSWWPGWNSNQSMHKFQQEYRGPELEQQHSTVAFAHFQSPGWFKWRNQWSGSKHRGYRLLFLGQVFGSDGLSLEAPAIAELCERAQLWMRQDQADGLGLKPGQWVQCDGLPLWLQVGISKQVPQNCLLAYVPADEALPFKVCEHFDVADLPQAEALEKQYRSHLDDLKTNMQMRQARLLHQDEFIPIRFVEGVN